MNFITIVDIIALVVAASIFGFWLAGQKFFIVPEKKHNVWAIRAVYAVPYSIICVLAVCFFLILVQALFMKGQKFDDFYDDYGLKPVIITSFISSCLLICVYQKYVVPKELPVELSEDFDDHEFYLFSPIKENFLISRPSDSGKTTADMFDRLMTEPIMIDLQKYEKSDMNAMYGSGEIIFRKDAADILNQNQLTGFSMLPVHDMHKKEYIPKMPYFHLNVAKNMPPADERTIFEIKKYSVSIKDMKVFYKKSDLKGCNDFNRMKENTGYTENNFTGILIVSAKAMHVLRSQIGFGKRDFQPVYLIDDSEEKAEIENPERKNIQKEREKENIQNVQNRFGF